MGSSAHELWHCGVEDQMIVAVKRCPGIEGSGWESEEMPRR